MGEKDFIQEQYESEQRMGQNQPLGGYPQQGVPQQGYQQGSQQGYQQQGNFNIQASINGRPVTNSNDASLVFKILGCVFMGIGVLLIAICLLVSHFLNEKYDRCTETTTGIVINNVSNGEGAYAPVFKYEVDGKEYEDKSSLSTDPPKYEVGDEIEVHYNPDKPEEYYVDKVLIVVQIVLYAIGGFFFIFGLVFFVVGINVKRKGQSV